MHVNKIKKNLEIDLKIEETGRPEIDSLFINAIHPLAVISRIVNTFEKAESNFFRSTFTFVLENSTLSDSIAAMLYFLSSSADDDFNELELKLIEEYPYLTLNEAKIKKYVEPVVKAWKDLISHVNESWKTIEKLTKVISEIEIEFNNATDKVKEVCNQQGMDIADSAKAIKIVMRNRETLKRASETLGIVQRKMNFINETCQGLSKKYGDEELQRIYAIGKEIKNAHVKNMRDVILNFWPEKNRINLRLGSSSINSRAIR